MKESPRTPPSRRRLWIVAPSALLCIVGVVLLAEQTIWMGKIMKSQQERDFVLKVQTQVENLQNELHNHLKEAGDSRSYTDATGGATTGGATNTDATNTNSVHQDNTPQPDQTSGSAATVQTETQPKVVPETTTDGRQDTCSALLSDLPYLDQINLDLQPFANGISAAMYQDAFDFIPPSVRMVVHIRNNRIYTSKNNTATKSQRDQPLLSMFLKIMCMVELPDTDFILFLGDDLWSPFPIAPFFHFQKVKQGPGILVPYSAHLADLNAFYKESITNYGDWNAKLPKAVFRGASSGGHKNESNWYTFPRSQLVLKCRTEPLKDICDAGFIGIVLANKVTEDIMRGMDTIRDLIGLEQQMQYKYLLSVDGNGPCAGRFEHYLFGNSLILKHRSEHIEFYYSALKPDEHYISIEPDMSDLEQKIKWAIANDDAVQKIVANMHDFTKYLSEDRVACYVQQVMQKYTDLLQFTIEPLEKLLPTVDLVLPGHSYQNTVFPATCKNPIYSCHNYTDGIEMAAPLPFFQHDNLLEPLCKSFNGIEKQHFYKWY